MSRTCTFGACDKNASSPATGTRASDAPRPAAPARVGPPKSANDEVDELVRENLDAELLEQPIVATWLGVHAWDDHVDNVRPEPLTVTGNDESIIGKGHQLLLNRADDFRI